MSDMTKHIIDVDTAEGMAELVAILPTENLRSLAARGNVAAECELMARGEA